MNDLHRPSQDWWETVFLNPADEEASYVLISLGAAGLSHTESGRFSAYLQGTEEELRRFTQAAEGLGFRPVSVTAVPERNWLNQCPELWEPIRIGDFTVVPVSSRETAVFDPDPARVLLIPGLGFGTGHHATTRMVGEFLRHRQFLSFRPEMALDLGTGSGLLALLAKRILGCPVLAVDCDQNALINAQDNLEINRETGSIELKLADAAKITGKFGLIMANLYAELLTNLSGRIRTLLEPGGYLVISGVIEPQLELVISSYHAQGFRVLETRQEGEWRAALLTAD